MHRLPGKAPHTAQQRFGQRRVVVPLGQVIMAIYLSIYIYLYLYLSKYICICITHTHTNKPHTPHRLSGEAPHTAQQRLGQRWVVVALGQVIMDIYLSNYIYISIYLNIYVYVYTHTHTQKPHTPHRLSGEASGAA